MDKRPSFIETWLDDIKDIYVRDSWWGIFPVALLACAAGGSAAAYFMPPGFFSDLRWDVSATIYTGLLAFNALTLALAWSALGRIYESASQPGFSAFLKAGGVLSKYLFYISYIHTTQVIAAFVTLTSMVLLFIPLPSIIFDRIAFGATICATLYALRWALGAVTVAQDLNWHYAAYDELEPDEKQNLRLAVSNDHAS